MSNEVKHREIVVRENFSRDGIAIMLVQELLVWFRAAEEVEARLAALVEQPRNIGARTAFDDALQAFTERPIDWLVLQSSEKAPEADMPGQIKGIRKLFGQVDFFLMPDPKVSEEQALSGIKARVRSQAGKIDAALNRLAGSIQDFMAPRI
jgi:hypothetical protein